MVRGWARDLGRVASSTEGHVPPRALETPTKDSHKVCVGQDMAALQAMTQHTSAKLGRPSALELPPEAGGPLPGGLGQSAPRNAPSFTNPPPTCPPVPTAGNSCGWHARGPHVTRLSCRCARVNRPWSEVMPAQGDWNQRRVGGPWDWKWPGCPLTGFWGLGVRSQGEKGQACRTEEGGHAAGPRGQWPPAM